MAAVAEAAVTLIADFEDWLVSENRDQVACGPKLVALTDVALSPIVKCTHALYTAVYILILPFPEHFSPSA